MRQEYADWIATNYPTYESAYGKCESATRQMMAAFPELKQVRGHYYDALWGVRAHWWLTAPSGAIVDPTAIQFPTKGAGHYEPWPEDRPLPTNACMNCGEYCYFGQSFCSADCYEDTRESGDYGFMRPLDGFEVWTPEDQIRAVAWG